MGLNGLRIGLGKKITYPNNQSKCYNNTKLFKMILCIVKLSVKEFMYKIYKCIYDI